MRKMKRTTRGGARCDTLTMTEMKRTEMKRHRLEEIPRPIQQYTDHYWTFFISLNADQKRTEGVHLWTITCTCPNNLARCTLG
jgi:hypothetical protein